ncbi:hypothetical protein MXB_4190 [Myxobolus squamalis]|nr:hypothetical protein MXB_4190 [Myxobolus squamalis]
MSEQDVLFPYKLMDCCDRPGFCFLSFCCPCIAAGYIGTKLGQNKFLWCCGTFCCNFIALPFLRNSTRNKLGVTSDILDDVAVGWACDSCTLTQCYRSLEEAEGTIAR